jgi:hypothetical protein
VVGMCKSCVYYKGEYDVIVCAKDSAEQKLIKLGDGQCRRFAPSQDKSFGWVWPNVRFNDWCGEYAAKKE